MTVIAGGIYIVRMKAGALIGAAVEMRGLDIFYLILSSAPNSTSDTPFVAEADIPAE